MSLLFYIFSGLMLGFGVMVIVCRNPLSSALCLVISFLGLAALFVTLNAYFISIIQILVYTGAVMVLFLFIIMLLDIREEKNKDWNYWAVGGGTIILFGFVVQLISVLGGYEEGKQKMVPFPENVSHEDVKIIGAEIFTYYNFHLQILGVLLLVATIGVVVLSRRQGKEGKENN
ncbi:MAG: NADH-quinone oxidoreductase subunit J [Verrucomicrobiota bacterium]|nr:NADH-quinone oxidoreductase subunit J [Verrucomicrobiota bacterium]